MFKKIIAILIFLLIIQPVSLNAAFPLEFIIGELISLYRAVNGEKVDKKRYDDICRRLDRIENSVRNYNTTDPKVGTISKEDYRTIVNSVNYLKGLTYSFDTINDKIDNIENKTNLWSNNISEKLDRMDTNFSGKLDRMDTNFSGKLDRMDTNFSRKLDRIDYTIKKLSSLFLTLNEPWGEPLKKGISSIECEETIPYSLCSGFEINNRNKNLFYSETSPYYLSIDIENINVDLENSQNCIVQETIDSVFYKKNRECSGKRCCSAYINSDIIISLKKNGEVITREQTSVACLNAGKKFQITHGVPFIMDRRDAKECEKNIITKGLYGINSIENYLVSRNERAMQALKELSY